MIADRFEQAARFPTCFRAENVQRGGRRPARSNQFAKLVVEEMSFAQTGPHAWSFRCDRENSKNGNGFRRSRQGGYLDDFDYMRLALREARKGLGWTSPNPTVGAVIVREGKILARGYHRAAGKPHAEIEALRRLRMPTNGATMYVTLEPCSTQGRTPPCVDALIAARLGRVVIGTADPNPSHRGRAPAILRKAGIEVRLGVLEKECAALNRGFNEWIVSGRPYVVAKVGMSLDGRLTRPPGEGQWLTSDRSRSDAHRLRSQVDAILIGGRTAREDNPRLTIRGIRGAPQPWRIVVCRSALPPDLHVLTDSFRERTLVYHDQSLGRVLVDLGRRGVTSVLIEGGMRVLGEAFDRRLVHAVHLYLAPLVCGGPVLSVGGRGAESSARSPWIRDPAYERLGSDLRITGEVVYPGGE